MSEADQPDLGLWAGFLDRLPAGDAVACAQELEHAGVTTIWLQEFSGVDPFVRAALYLGATSRLTVAIGVAVIHARDAEAMVAVSSTLEEAFPGRFVLGLGVSHGSLMTVRGHDIRSPLTAMRSYLALMDELHGKRVLPRRVLGALGPRMTELAGTAADGAHTYFSPVGHTVAARAAMGPNRWLAPTLMVALDQSGPDWREHVRPYLGLCLGLPNYTKNLQRFGVTDEDLTTTSDALVDAIVVPDDPAQLMARVDAHRAAGADQVVLQFIPPPRAELVMERVSAGFPSRREDTT